MPGNSPLVPGNVVQIKIRGAVLGRRTMMATFWQVMAQGIAGNYTGDVSAINTAVVAGLLPSYANLMATNWAATRIDIQRVAETGTAYPAIRSLLYKFPNTTAGGGPGPSNQSEACLGLQRTSFLAGKTQRGEMRLGPIADSWIASDKPTSGALLQLTLVAGNLVSTLLFGTTGSMQPGAFHLQTKGAPHQPNFTSFYTYSLPTWATSQKRRRYTPYAA